MEPIPETRETVEEFGPFGDDDDVLGRLTASAARVRELVPTCVGISVSVFTHDVVLTLVATDPTIGALDAVQYLTDRPCLAALEGPRAGQVQAYDHDDLLDEEAWRLFARSTAAHGLNATLTLPVMTGDRVEGSINLYATEPGAFEGHHEEVAEVFGAWAPGAVRDADLDFTTLRAARETPDRQRDQVTISRAASLFAGALRIGDEQARDQIREASARAGVTEAALSETILRTMGSNG
ncbi:MAG: hypothetical protein JWN84_3208 [Nocardioides sp.]|nr:hypothetical protein [Nocardioides sp.]